MTHIRRHVGRDIITKSLLWWSYCPEWKPASSISQDMMQMIHDGSASDFGSAVTICPKCLEAWKEAR